MKAQDLYLQSLDSGTTIDHIPAKKALKVLEKLELDYDGVTTVAINVDSAKLGGGKKDLIFIENKELTQREVDKIALIARGATVNWLKDHQVLRKERLGIPEHVEGIIQCINPNCVTNKEGIETQFSIQQNPLRAKCYYCEKTMLEKELEDGIR